MKRPIILIIALITLVFFSSCAQETRITTPTSEFCNAAEITKFSEKFLPLLQNYYDQVLAVRSAEKSALQDEMAKLESIQREADGLVTNACTKNLKIALIGAAESSLAYFRSEFAGEPEATRQVHFDSGTDFIRQINLGLAKLADCMPSCKPK